MSSRAGAGPTAGVGRQHGIEPRALNTPHGAHPIEADGAPDRRQTQDQQQGRQNLVDAVDEIRIAVDEGDVADKDDPFDPVRSPPGGEGGAAEQKQRIKGDPLPWRGEIEENGLHPRVRIPERERARQQAGVSPEFEQIRTGAEVVEQERRADPDPHQLQWRRRPLLEPKARPSLLGGGKRLPAGARGNA